MEVIMLLDTPGELSAEVFFKINSGKAISLLTLIVLTKLEKCYRIKQDLPNSIMIRNIA
jgi:hypothetical protein